MTVKKLSLALAVPFIGLALVACSQDQAGPSTAGDTAVHTAEVAAANTAALMKKGKGVYAANCGVCHQSNGEGLAGAFPPLAGSDFLKGDRRKVMAAALFGLSGPITVNGVDYNGVMPSLGHLADEDLAAALTYVFGSWGNDGAAVSVEEVAALRAEPGQEDRGAPGATQGERIEGAPSANSGEELHNTN